MKLRKINLIGSTAAMIAGMTSVAFADISSTPQTLPSDVIKIVGNVLGAVQAVGIIAAVGMLLYAGFKFLTAGAGEKAKAKDMLVPFAVGAGLVALAPAIANWVWGTIMGVT